MRKPPRFASTIHELCKYVPMSQPWYYLLRKKKGCPVPRKDGTHSIAQWRKFSKARQPSGEKVFQEKRQLELQLLKSRIARNEFELDEARDGTRREILERLTAEFEKALFVLRGNLEKLRLELAPRFSGLDARSIYTLWRNRENEMLVEVVSQLESHNGRKARVKAMPQTSVLNGGGGRVKVYA
jgi:hypothetical protein